MRKCLSCFRICNVSQLSCIRAPLIHKYCVSCTITTGNIDDMSNWHVYPPYTLYLSKSSSLIGRFY